MPRPLLNWRFRLILHLRPVFDGLIVPYITRMLQKIAANTKNRVFNLPHTFSNQCVHYIFTGCGKCEWNKQEAEPEGKAAGDDAKTTLDDEAAPKEKGTPEDEAAHKEDATPEEEAAPEQEAAPEGKDAADDDKTTPDDDASPEGNAATEDKSVSEEHSAAEPHPHQPPVP